MRTRPTSDDVDGDVCLRGCPRPVFSILSFAVALALSSRSQAQEKVPLAPAGTGADTHLFRPPIDSKGFLSTNGADIVGHLDFSLGLILDYGYGIMPTTRGESSDEGKHLLQHSFQGTLQLNLGIANVVVVGLSAPVVLAGHERARDIGPTGALYTSEGNFAQGIEHVAAHAKVRIVRPLDRPSIGLAAIVQGGVGVSGSDNLIAENGGFVWPQIAFEGRPLPDGALRIGLSGGFRANFGGTPASFGVNENGVPVLEHGVFEYGQLATTGLGLSMRVAEPLDVVADTYSTILVTGENALAQRVSAEALGGLKVFIDGKSFLYLGGGGGYAPGFQTAAARGTIGFVFEPSIGDQDRDGIKDDIDACPNAAEDIDDFEDDNGCPDLDNDDDGVLDVDDACPNVRGVPSANPDKNGCPKPVESRPPRRDPPPKPPAFVGTTDIFVLKEVQFETASAKILPASDETLEGVATILKNRSDLTLVEIQGHADERGGEAYNLGLTKRRAASVLEALVERGVERGRLRSIGFGPYCPLDEGHDEAAWEKNRRVEFKIVRIDGEPTDVKLGCERAKEKGVESLPP